jgi:DNA-binding NtrC family response regulator/tetratricopeptide (TPR) repeat protein
LEPLPPFAFRKNLEQIEAENTAGDWRIGAYLDLVSERKFLLFRLKSERISGIHPDVFAFRAKTAASLAPGHCPQIVDSAQKNNRLDVLTAYLEPLSAVELDDDEAAGMFRSLIETLAVFERHCFSAPGTGLESIGRDEDGTIILMPNAYLIPAAANDGVDGGQEDRASAPQAAKRRRSEVTVHLKYLAGMMLDLSGGDDGRGTAAEPRSAVGGDSSPFRDRLVGVAEAILSGAVKNLSALHETLFETALADELQPYPTTVGCAADNRPPVDEHEIASVLENGTVVEVSGGGASGKTATLHRIASFLASGDGREARWIDEWDLASIARKRAGAREHNGRRAVWLVDDIDDKSIARLRLFDQILGQDSPGQPAGDGFSLVYSVNRSSISNDLAEFLDAVRESIGERYRTVDLDARADGADGGPSARIGELLRAVAPDKTDAAGKKAELLVGQLLAALLPQERQILELLSVARFPLPHEIVLSVFSESSGDLHRRVHRLAGLGLLRIDYRPLPPTGQTTITLNMQSATLRRLIYDGISDERRENLHRTVARMAEDRGGVPTLFVYEHLVAGNERRSAARYGMAFLKETPREKRAAYLEKLIAEFVDGGLVEELSFANRLFVMHELGVDLLAAGRRKEAETLLLDIKELVDDADSEDRRKSASLVCEIFGLLADTWAVRGNYSPALSLLTRTKESLNPYLSLLAQARLLNDIGWLQYRLGEYDKAVESCKLSLNSLNANEHPLVVAQALNIMGVINFNTSRYDEAISYYDQSAFLREREGDVTALSASYNNLALAYQTKGEYDKALSYYNKSLEIKKLQNNRVGIAAGCLNLALLYLEVHNFEEAEKNCHESLAISTDLGNTRLTAENHSALGDIEFTRGHYDAAEEYYRQSLGLAYSLETVNEEMGAHRRLAKLYLTTGRHEQARDSIGKAATLGRQIGSRYEDAQIETVLGDLERKESRDSEAIKHYESAAGAYAAVSKYRLAAPVLARIGQIHFEKGNVFEAKQYLDRALELTRTEIGREIPDEIVTLQQMLREKPIQGGAKGTDSQKLLYAFYELSSLSDYAEDRVSFFKRVINVFQDLTASTQCYMTIQTGEGQFAAINLGGDQEPLVDPGLRALCTRALQMGTLLDALSAEVADLRGQIPVPAGNAFVCVPMRAMGRNLGCLIMYVPEGNVPLSKEDANFLTSLGRHIAGDVRLMLHLEEHAHKEETLEKQFESLQAQVVEQYRFENLIGKDESMKKIFRTLDKVKDMDTGLLIIGESGTGKTELARTIHYNSPRRKRPFQQLHCAEIPFTLLESELFGHEKGAFTGAVQRKLGRCEVADRGTVFLDDVNVVPSETQSKLLHYLDNKSFMRLGGTQKITTDVRIIAASNQDLEQLVKEGKFREDLFYRLKVILIELPPLRERKEDMIAIAQAFLKKRCQAQGKPLKTLSTETIKLFQKHLWPGNVRELQNVLEQVVLLSDDDIIAPSSLPEDFLKKATGSGRRQTQSLEALAQQMIESGGYSEANPLMPQLEALLAGKMSEHIKSKGKAASLLGITKPTLYTRLKGYDKLQ